MVEEALLHMTASCERVAALDQERRPGHERADPVDHQIGFRRGEQAQPDAALDG
jgi:hypothetical protein